MVINRSQEKLQGGLIVEGGIMIGCICRLQVDSSITGGLACVTGEGIWGRDRARAGKGGGECVQASRSFRHPSY